MMFICLIYCLLKFLMTHILMINKLFYFGCKIILEQNELSSRNKINRD